MRRVEMEDLGHFTQFGLDMVITEELVCSYSCSVPYIENIIQIIGKLSFEDKEYKKKNAL